MKNLIMGLAALSCIMMFAQCANKGGQETATNDASGALSDMKVAFVEIDTLLAKYNFCIDLNEAMVKKSENVRLQLNQKAQDLQKQQQEFRWILSRFLSIHQIHKKHLFLRHLQQKQRCQISKKLLTRRKETKPRIFRFRNQAAIFLR